MERWIEIRPIERAADESARQAEQRTWREIVRERLGVAASYNANGAPTVPDGFIGISHTHGWVAVAWSPTPCGVDIELKNRPLSAAVTERYGFRTMAEWCALEAQYKLDSQTVCLTPSPTLCFPEHPTLVVALIW